MGKLKAIFTIPELRQKILLTLLFLAIYRVGYSIPLPFVDQRKMNAGLASTGGLGQVLNYVSMFSGGALSHAPLFGLGIMPYIPASIIFQLLASVYPPLEKLQKEGEAGRKKINEYTRYATVVICLFQSWMWVMHLVRGKQEGGLGLAYPNYDGFFFVLTTIITMTTGTVFLMWIGEQIDEYGIGNGISLLIMAGILARMPAALLELYQNSTTKLSAESGKHGIITLVLLAIVFLAVVVGVIAITESQRRIPTQSAKHVRGRRVYGGTKQYLPLKVNQAGVMPIIFASSLLMFPYFILNSLKQAT